MARSSALFTTLPRKQLVSRDWWTNRVWGGNQRLVWFEGSYAGLPWILALVGGRCMDPCLKWEELFQTMLVFENYPEEEADERVQVGGKVEGLCLFQTLTSNIKITWLSVSIVHGQPRAFFFDWCGDCILACCWQDAGYSSLQFRFSGWHQVTHLPVKLFEFVV